MSRKFTLDRLLVATHNAGKLPNRKRRKIPLSETQGSKPTQPLKLQGSLRFLMIQASKLMV